MEFHLIPRLVGMLENPFSWIKKKRVHFAAKIAERLVSNEAKEPLFSESLIDPIY